MIYFDRVTKVYNDGTKAVEDIDLKIQPNEFVSIIGPSGAGKTTLIKMLLAEEKPTDGSVYFESSEIHSLRKKDVRKLRRRIGTIFQDFRLITNKTNRFASCNCFVTTRTPTAIGLPRPSRSWPTPRMARPIMGRRDPQSGCSVEEYIFRMGTALLRVEPPRPGIKPEALAACFYST